MRRAKVALFLRRLADALDPPEPPKPVACPHWDAYEVTPLFGRVKRFVCVECGETFTPGVERMG